MKNVMLARSLAVATYLLPTASPSIAQQSEDTKAILNALKNLDGRMDGMQKQIDDLKSGGAKAPAAAPTEAAKAEAPPSATPTPSAGSALPPGMKAVPGWVVNVLPYVENVREPDPLFLFSQSKLPMNFGAHLATRSVDDWVKYKAEAKFNVYEAGRHVLLVEIKAPAETTARCGGYLKIGENVVVDLKEGVGGSSRTTNFDWLPILVTAKSERYPPH